MELKDFAKRFNNRGEGVLITREENELLEELGFVVVYGYSDDNTEFRGAIFDEVGSYNGGEIFITKDGIFEGCECECKYSEEAKKQAKLVDVIWEDGEGYAWSYVTDIPHETFDILDEEGNKWCRGIIFDINNIEED